MEQCDMQCEQCPGCGSATARVQRAPRRMRRWARDWGDARLCVVRAWCPSHHCENRARGAYSGLIVRNGAYRASGSP